jgi:NADPH:quinone reductase-like Zn-dependent oxidoreductase
MAREWVIARYDGIDALELRDCDIEEPGPGEARLNVEAFALNWGDMDLMQGRYSFNFSELPARIGCEAVGIVDAVGDGVDGIAVGDRYCTLPHFYNMRGMSADSIVIDARYLTKAPDGLSAVESGSIWMQYMTAYYPIVELGKAAPGVNILVTAATSTAGYSAIEIGSKFGANMIGTSRFEYNRDYLRDGGANHVHIGDERGLADALREFTDGEGVHAVFDSIGAGMIDEYSQSLAMDAQLFTYGTLDEHLPALPMVALYQANATFKPYSLFNYVENEAMKEKGLAYMYAALKAGDIRPNIDRVYAMSEYQDAWRYLREPRKVHGKVMIATDK